MVLLLISHIIGSLYYYYDHRSPAALTTADWKSMYSSCIAIEDMIYIQHHFKTPVHLI